MRRHLTTHLRDRLIRDDRGLSAAELMISVSLMVIVLGSAWGFSSAMQKGQDVSDREAALADAIGIPLGRMQEIILQNNSIDINQDHNQFVLTVRTDQDLNDVYERHKFTATGPDETVLPKNVIFEQAWNLDPAGNPVGNPFISTVIGRNNNNRDSNTRLFHYYDAEGKEIAVDPPYVLDVFDPVPSATKYVVISICSTVDGRTVIDTSTVQFRNRD